MEYVLTLIVSIALVGLGAWWHEKRKAQEARRRLEDMILAHGKRPRL